MPEGNEGVGEDLPAEVGGGETACRTAVEMLEDAVDRLATKLGVTMNREERRAVVLDLDRLSRTFRRLVLVERKRADGGPDIGTEAPSSTEDAVRVGEIARNLKCAELVSMTRDELADFGRRYYEARRT
jgi:hypothetical protein